MGAAHAEASIALGLGANVLVGGANGSVALQPVSAGGEVGFDFGAGVGEPTLQPAHRIALRAAAGAERSPIAAA